MATGRRRTADHTRLPERTYRHTANLPGQSIGGTVRRSTTLAGALVLAALVLVGTSSIVSAGHATLHLRPFLLSVEQMPTGWTAQHSTDAVGTGCPKPKGIKVTQDVTASFAGGGADVVEQLKTYSVAVDKAYSRVLRSLNACQHEKVREGTKSVNASVGAMSLPQYGNKSEAFNATWTDKGKSANIYEVAVRSGNIVVTVAERGSGGLSQFEAVTSLAMSKLPFGGKARP
jgi:hypothetical protein